MVLTMDQEYRKRTSRLLSSSSKLDPLTPRDSIGRRQTKREVREGGRLETIMTQAKKAWLSSDIFPFMKLAIGPKSQLSYTGSPQEEKNVS
jgi:hypothetical protein